MASTGDRPSAALVTFGLLLAVVAGFGPWVYDATHHDGTSEIPVESLERRPGEAVLPYATRVNRAVYQATYHCEPTTPQTWASAVLAPVSAAVGHQEGMLVAERLRCGFCSQVSFVVSDILSRNGVAAHARGLDGHVVVGFTHRGRDYVADPDLRSGPFHVEWDEPASLAATVSRVYAGWGPRPHGMQNDLVDVFTDTATDGVQYAPTMRAIARSQEWQLRAVEWLRWVLVAVGAGLMLVRRRSLPDDLEAGHEDQWGGSARGDLVSNVLERAAAD